MMLSEKLEHWSWRVGPPGDEVKKMIKIAKKLQNFVALAREYSEQIAEVLPELGDALSELENLTTSPQ